MEFALIILGLVGTWDAVFIERDRLGILLKAAFLLAVLYFFYHRIRRAHFDWLSNILAIFGLPLFAILLLNSYISHKKGSVDWKGRRYRTATLLGNGHSEAARASLALTVPGITERKSGHSL